jgi:hypothetical protein
LVTFDRVGERLPALVAQQEEAARMGDAVPQVGLRATHDVHEAIAIEVECGGDEGPHAAHAVVRAVHERSAATVLEEAASVLQVEARHEEVEVAVIVHVDCERLRRAEERREHARLEGDVIEPAVSRVAEEGEPVERDPLGVLQAVAVEIPERRAPREEVAQRQARAISQVVEECDANREVDRRHEATGSEQLQRERDVFADRCRGVERDAEGLVPVPHRFAGGEISESGNAFEDARETAPGAEDRGHRADSLPAVHQANRERSFLAREEPAGLHSRQVDEGSGGDDQGLFEVEPTAAESAREVRVGRVDRLGACAQPPADLGRRIVRVAAQQHRESSRYMGARHAGAGQAQVVR